MSGRPEDDFAALVWPLLEAKGFLPEAILGAGRYSTVFRARRAEGGGDTQPLAVRVLKFASQMKHESRTRRNRFTYWLCMRLLGSWHPNLMRCYKTGRLPAIGPDGPEKLLYVVQELVEGKTVHELIIGGELRRLGLAGAMALFEQALDVARFLKSRWLRHGDLETVNLMVTPEGDLKVIDFEPRLGIGKPHRRDLVKLSATLARMLTGCWRKTDAIPVDPDVACRWWFGEEADDAKHRLMVRLAEFTTSVSPGGSRSRASLAEVQSDFRAILDECRALGEE